MTDTTLDALLKAVREILEILAVKCWDDAVAETKIERVKITIEALIAKRKGKEKTDGH